MRKLRIDEKEIKNNILYERKEIKWHNYPVDIGDRFGCLEVNEPPFLLVKEGIGLEYVRCICDCGKEIYFYCKELNDKKIHTHCGCNSRINSTVKDGKRKCKICKHWLYLNCFSGSGPLEICKTCSHKRRIQSKFAKFDIEFDTSLLDGG